MNLKQFIKVFAVSIFFLIFTVFNVNAQSQSDVTVCEFNASSQENLYIQLNYSCENIQWLPKAYDVYRKIDMTVCPDPDSAGALSSSAQFLKANGSSISVQENYPVEDYLLFFTEGDLSERETVTWFENQYPNIDNLSNRKLPRPFLVDDSILGRFEGNEELSSKLEPHKGSIVCPTYNIVGGQYDSNSVTGFVRADLVPPTAQQFENLVVDAIYLLWGFVFIYGIVMLTYIGFQFIYGGTSPERLGELKAKLGLWFVGLLLIILAIPFINFIYSIAGISTTKCYQYSVEENGETSTVYDLTLPGFTFFFNNVCTGEFAIED